MIKASQAVSGEILIDRLIETLMRIAIEHAGPSEGYSSFSCGGDAVHRSRRRPEPTKMVEVTVRQEP